jgi:MFS transporter, DHA2 family, multidrug resistance protein
MWRSRPWPANCRCPPEPLQWIVDGYTVALGCLLLLFGAMGDRFGRRRMLLVGLGVFAAASVLAAYAPSTNVLIGARILAGVGGAVILPYTLASVLSLFPDPGERATALGVWFATIGLGVVIGPVTGGVLLDHFWFGSVFLLNVPIALTAFVFTFCVLPRAGVLAAVVVWICRGPDWRSWGRPRSCGASSKLPIRAGCLCRCSPP